MNGRTKLTLAFVAFVLVGAVPLVSSAAAELIVLDYTLASSQRVGRTEFDYIFRVTIRNNGPALRNVTGTVTSRVSSTRIIEAALTFGNVAANASVTSQDTITVRQDRLFPFDRSVLSTAFVWQPEAEIVLDVSRRAISEITPKGGVVSTTGSDGNVYTVFFPPAAIESPTSVSITPLVSLTGIPMAGGVKAAVQLEPSGLTLLKPATVTINFARELPTKPIGFLLSEGAPFFQLMPVELGVRSISTSLHHFSEAGVVDLEDSLDDEVIRTVMEMYFGTSGLLASFASNPSCVTLQKQIGNRVLSFVRTTDVVADAFPDSNIPPTPCVFDPQGGIGPFQCTTISHLGDAAEESLLTVTTHAFTTADQQCPGGNASGDRDALHCVKLALQLEELPRFNLLDTAFLAEKSCGIASIGIVPGDALSGTGPELLVGQAGTPKVEAQARDKDGNIIHGRALVWKALNPQILAATTGPATGAGGTSVSLAALLQGGAALEVVDKIAVEELELPYQMFRFDDLAVGVTDLSGLWNIATTSTNASCTLNGIPDSPHTPVEAPPPPFAGLVTQTGPRLTVQAAPEATIEIVDFDRLRVSGQDAPNRIAFDLPSTSNTPQCAEFFADASGFVGCRAGDRCVITALSCREAISGNAEILNGRIVVGESTWRDTLSWIYRSFEGSQTPVTETVICNGSDRFHASR